MWNRAWLLGVSAVLAAQTVTVDLDARQGPLRPIWQFFGYDEPNYTYMKDGKKLLTDLANAMPGTVYVRAHNLLTSGDGTPALKWGSTNVYTEDAQGRPQYDWTIVDRIFDTYVERGMKPLVEIGFMPEALTSGPPPYKHAWRPDGKESIYTGWTYPPRDYNKWAELVRQWVLHCVQRYGHAEVETWLWELWNEPNISYWHGTLEEYCKLYDYTAKAVKGALPTARIGGPHSTGPGGERSAAFLRGFLEHVRKTGAPLDYIGFHAKGSPRVVDGSVMMGIQNQLRDLAGGFAVVASFPEFKDKPIIIGESDPEGCAACSARFHPQNAYRNGVMYSSYTAAVFPRHLDLAARAGVNLMGAVTWAFEFEDQPYFDGFRDLATNGIGKPVLNVFRMFGLMKGERVRAESTGSAGVEAMLQGGVRGEPDVGAMAAREGNEATVLLWNYHDSERPAGPARVTVTVNGINAERVWVEHFRVDREYSNSYEAWKAMGSPQRPSPEQYRALERAGHLHSVQSPQWMTARQRSVELPFELPRHGVSLLRLSW